MFGKNNVQMQVMNILVTCPPMLGMKEHFLSIFKEKGWRAICPEVVQSLSEDQLCELLPPCDGWIIGDDPATDRVFQAGSGGRLRAAVKWGIGTDNVDFHACKRLGIQIANTPAMFGQEVADIAYGYLIGLARQTYLVDRCVRQGGWPKPRGVSLAGKTAGILGYGDIGKNLARRMQASDMRVYAWDPELTSIRNRDAQLVRWPEKIEECDFLLVACALNDQNMHILDSESLARAKRGVRIINVSRGPLIDELALVASLRSGQVHSAALDVFEEEPLPVDSPLRDFDQCIFGTHNASNTSEAVQRTNLKAIEHLETFLGERA